MEKNNKVNHSLIAEAVWDSPLTSYIPDEVFDNILTSSSDRFYFNIWYIAIIFYFILQILSELLH